MPNYEPTAWGQSLFDVKLPSGQLCQARYLQIEDLVELGIMEQVDILGNTVQEQVIDPVKKPQDRKSKKPTKAQAAAEEQRRDQEIMKEVLGDKTKFSAMLEIMDKATWACVVQPRLTLPYQRKADGTMVKIPHAERDPNAIYTDSISIEDKMHLFDVCFGGMYKLKQFRQKPQDDVGTVAGESEDAGDPKSTDATSG